MVLANMTWEMPFEIFVFTAHADPVGGKVGRYMPDSTLFEHVKNHFTWLTGSVDCFGMAATEHADASLGGLPRIRQPHTRAFTRQYGTTPSMPTSPNTTSLIAPIDAVEKGFRITPTGVGEYDYHVVKCLYKPVP
ncbi:MAG: hypothetical protein ACLVK4_14435 [Alistipes shahii]|uniref:hypothetical protein n=1 Tax=Alistipes shahii TaxID=328814 RepID=UPI00399D4EC7